MNERIKELMVELKKTVSTHRGAEVLIGYDEIEKFAELIVKECLGIVDNNSEGPVEQWDRCARIISQGIKEHFGVKE